VFVWEYDDLLSSMPDTLEPMREFCCRAKLASLAYSRHQRALLAAGWVGGAPSARL